MLDNTLSDSLPNGYRSNGVVNFCQNTKPVAVAVGDRWYKPSDGSDWYWNGSLWLSPETLVLGNDYKEIPISANGATWGAGLTGRTLSSGKSGIYFISIGNSFYSSSLSDFSNNWQIVYTAFYSDQTSDTIASLTNMNIGANIWAEVRSAINSQKSTVTKTLIFVYGTATKVGNPANVFVMTGLEFKWVHP